MPPSTVSSCPVTKVESSLARKSAACATSSGGPESADFPIAGQELRARVDQEAPALALGAIQRVLEDSANRRADRSAFERFRQAADPEVRVAPKAGQEQGALVAERVVQALPGQAGGLQ